MKNRRAEVEKLKELRARTDQQLIALIDRLLERGIRAAHVVPEEAERAHAEASALLSAVAPADRRRVAPRLAHLRELLHTSSFAAC